MRAQVHSAFGMTIALLAVQPTTFKEVACATAGGIIGGVIADIDLNNHKASNDNKKDILQVGYSIFFACIILAVDYLLGDGVCKYVLSHLNYTTLACSALFSIGLIFGYRSSHRSFMHSIFALCFFTAMAWIAFKPLTIPFAVGYLSHILLDLTNKTGIQLFFPISRRYCFGWCRSSGEVNEILVGFGKVISGILVCFYILRARVIYHDGTELFDMLNMHVINRISLFQFYLIIVNIVAVLVYMSLFTYSMARYEETVGRQGLYFWFFELLCLIGGAIGILCSLIKTEQKLGKHSATMYVYAFSMLEVWCVLYMIIVNPFRQTLTAIQTMDLSHHSGFLLYFAVVNILLLLIFIIDRNNRHNTWERIETVKVFLGLLGGSFLIQIVGWFHGFRGNAVFGWAFSILCVAHSFTIGYLLCAGLI